MFYPESRCFPSVTQSEDSQACSQAASYKWSVGHACELSGCCPRGLQTTRHTNMQKFKKKISGLMETLTSYTWWIISLPGQANTHSHCAMAKTRSRSSRSSLCSRGGPKRKCVIAARPVLRMVGWMFFCRWGWR